MSNWSSFEKDKIVTDALRSFLNETAPVEINEGVAATLKGLVGGTKKSEWEKIAKGEDTGETRGTVYRNIIAEVTQLISNIAERLQLQIDTMVIVEEFEEMITAQNFELAEQVVGRRLLRVWVSIPPPEKPQPAHLVLALV